MPWANHPNITAILAAHYPGQETGNSIVDVLYGDVNPSGYLLYTIAKHSTDYNTAITNSTELLHTKDPNAWQADFSEGLLIDYRYFDAANISVQFEFGFGLSYTTFELSRLSVAATRTGKISPVPPPAAVAPGGNPALWIVLFKVTAILQNIGSIAGAAVPQLYLKFPK